MRCVGVVESVAVRVAVAVPVAVGVPEMTPVESAIESPAGKPVAVHEYDAVPPVAVAVAEYAVPANPSGNAVGRDGQALRYRQRERLCGSGVRRVCRISHRDIHGAGAGCARDARDDAASRRRS